MSHKSKGNGKRQVQDALLSWWVKDDSEKAKRPKKGKRVKR